MTSLKGLQLMTVHCLLLTPCQKESPTTPIRIFYDCSLLITGEGTVFYLSMGSLQCS